MLKKLKYLVFIAIIVSFSCDIFRDQEENLVQITSSDVEFKHLEGPYGRNVEASAYRNGLQLVATDAYIFSKTEGKDWKIIDNISNIEAIVISSNGSVILAGENSVYHGTIENGFTEIFSTSTVSYRGVYKLIEIKPNILMLALKRASSNITSPLIYRSENSGESWTPISDEEGLRRFYDIEVYKDTVYAVGTSGLEMSTDSGLNWVVINPDLNQKRHIEIGGGEMYFGESYDIYRASFSDQSFISRVTIEGGVSAMEYDDVSGYLYYNDDAGFHRFNSGSMTKETISSIKTSEIIISEERLFFHHSNGLYEFKKSDETIDKIGVPSAIRSSSFLDNGLLLVHSNNNEMDERGVYLSNAEYSEWVKIHETVSLAESIRDVIFVFSNFTESIFEFSENFGESWTTIDIPIEGRFSLKNIFSNSSNSEFYSIIESEKGIIYKSVDNLVSWERYYTNNFGINKACINETGFLFVDESVQINVLDTNGESPEPSDAVSVSDKTLIKCYQEKAFAISSKNGNLEYSADGKKWETVFNYPKNYNIVDLNFDSKGQYIVTLFNTSEEIFEYHLYLPDQSISKLLFTSKDYSMIELITNNSKSYIVSHNQGIIEIFDY